MHRRAVLLPLGMSVEAKTTKVPQIRKFGGPSVIIPRRAGGHLGVDEAVVMHDAAPVGWM
jgi:hypothetical protein